MSTLIYMVGIKKFDEEGEYTEYHYFMNANNACEFAVSNGVENVTSDYCDNDEFAKKLVEDVETESSETESSETETSEVQTTETPHTNKLERRAYSRTIIYAGVIYILIDSVWFKGYYYHKYENSAMTENYPHLVVRADSDIIVGETYDDLFDYLERIYC